MNETEIERLIVRMIGDAESYLKMLRDAQAATKEAHDAVKEQADSIEGFGRKLEGFAKSLGAALASYGAASFLRNVMHEFQGADETSRKLNATLEANGQEVDRMRERYDKFAETIERVTTLSADDARALLQQAGSLGVFGASAMRAVKNVQAARAMGVHGFGIRQAVQLERGQMNPRLARQLGLDTRMSEAEQAAAGLAKLEKGFAAAEAEAQSGTGAVKQLNNVLNNLRQDLGKNVDMVITPFVKLLKDAVEWFQKLPEPIKNVVKNTIILAAALIGVTAAIVAAGIAFNTFFGGIGIIAGAVVVGIVAISAAMATVVESMGGFEKIWGQVQAAAAKFWKFLQPFVDRFGQKLAKAFQYLSPLFEKLGEAVSKLFDSFDDRALQDLVDLAGEFALAFATVNLDMLVEGIRIAVNLLIVGVNTIKTWVDAFSGAWNGVRDAATFTALYVEYLWDVTFKRIGQNAVDVFGQMVRAAQNAAAGNWGGLAANVAMIGVKVQGKGEDFGSFAAKKLMERFKGTKIKDEIKDAGFDLGEDWAEQFNKGSKDGLDKWEATIFGSAEHVARTLQYRAGLPGAGSAFSVAADFLRPDQPARPTIMGATPVEMDTGGKVKDEEILKVLKDIAETLKKMGGPGPGNFGPAGLG